MTDSTTRPPRTEAGRAFIDMVGSKGWPATVIQIDREELEHFIGLIEAEATAPDAGLREALALALHQSRRSNEDPEYDMDVARERIDRMLANPHLAALTAHPAPAPDRWYCPDDEVTYIGPGCPKCGQDGVRAAPAGPAVDVDEYMCPNCVTPWKCNGPHIPGPTGDAE